MMQHGQMRIHSFQSNASNLSGFSEGHNIMPLLNSRLSVQSNNNSIDKIENQNFFTPNRQVNQGRLYAGSVQSHGAVNGSFQEKYSVHSRYSHLGGSARHLGDYNSTGAYNGSNFDAQSVHNEVPNQEPPLIQDNLIIMENN